MEWFFQNEILVIALTIVIYLLAEWIQKRTRILVLNPILVTIAILITAIKAFNIDYQDYHNGSKYIDFLLKPAVVALGVPLYLQLEKIKKQIVPILISQLVGCVVGIVSVVLIAQWMGAPQEIIYSLAPKSVTTPIAIEVSRTIGGIAPLTASVVIVVGIFGAIFGYGILHIGKVFNPIAQSLSIGSASHAVGTSKSMEISPNFGAMSSIGLILNGVFTAILAPYILKALEWIF